MNEKLKNKVLELAAIAKECPQNLQEKCFELLLFDYLERLRQGDKKNVEDQNIKEPTDSGEDKRQKEDKSKAQQEDIVETDLHVKTRQFLKKYGLTVDHLNQLYYKEESNFLPLYDDLKTTQVVESQIKIALLHALLNGMHSGNFEFNGEFVREEAQARKCYDMANFTANFKKHARLFDGFEKYKKTEPTVRLSIEGKKRLAEIIRELQ